MDVYAIVTEKIVNLLEQGIVPWRRPWSATGLPRNLISKKPYRGVNLFLLSATKYVSPFWLTMKQANELGGSVRKGEHSQIVVFWKVDQIANAGTETGTESDEADEKSRRRFVLRYYRLFNLEQCARAFHQHRRNLCLPFPRGISRSRCAEATQPEIDHRSRSIRLADIFV
jgi:antirestriction protein ArdC